MYDGVQHVIEDTNNQGVSTLVYQYNLVENFGWANGAHVNFSQFNGNYATDNSVIQYNIMYEAPSNTAIGYYAGGQMIQIASNTASAVNNISVNNNTLIAGGNSSNLSTSCLVDAGDTNAFGVVVQNNYLDYTGAYFPYYPGNTTTTYTNNISLVTGAVVPGN